MPLVITQSKIKFPVPLTNIFVNNTNSPTATAGISKFPTNPDQLQRTSPKNQRRRDLGGNLCFPRQNAHQLRPTTHVKSDWNSEKLWTTPVFLRKIFIDPYPRFFCKKGNFRISPERLPNPGPCKHDSVWAKALQRFLHNLNRSNIIGGTQSYLNVKHARFNTELGAYFTPKKSRGKLPNILAISFWLKGFLVICWRKHDTEGKTIRIMSACMLPTIMENWPRLR